MNQNNCCEKCLNGGYMHLYENKACECHSSHLPPEPKGVEGVLEEFDDKMWELKKDNRFENGETKTHEFGYRVERNEENAMAIYTIADWGNLRKFVAKAFQAGAEAEREKILNRIRRLKLWSKGTADGTRADILNSLTKEE